MTRQELIDVFNNMSDDEFEKINTMFIDELSEIKNDKKISEMFDVSDDAMYYWINEMGIIENEWYHENITECKNHVNWLKANYNISTSEDYIEKLYYRQLLERMLLQYSYQHGGNKISLEDAFILKYSIQYNSVDKSFGIDCTYNHIEFSTVYFYSEEIAQSAIKEVIEPFLEKYYLKLEDLFRLGI